MRTEQVVVVDDDLPVRDSLQLLLESAGYGVSTYESASRFLEEAPATAAACVVTDVRMPGLSGVELAPALRRQGKTIPVIVMTGHGDVALAVQAMKAGAVDFLVKPFDDGDLLRAIEEAVRRSPPGVGDPEREVAAQRIAALSGRERQVLDRLMAGKANKVVAQELGISPRTVEVYRANLMSKMGAESLPELVRMTLKAQES